MGKVRRRAALAREVNRHLQGIVRQKYKELHSNLGGASSKSRSVLALSLKDTETLTPAILNETCDQLQTFMFAGHDTTSILLSWVFYELSRTPQALEAVRTELDDLLGPDAGPATIRARLVDNPDLVQQMPYINAVIKETLRLHPSAGTARVIPKGSGFHVRMPDGSQQCLDGLMIYNCQALIHTDPKVYGDTATTFVPERWLAGHDAYQEIPAGAWRPFERGPRSCIGMELVHIEARVIVALAARRYDFVKVGLGEVVLDEKGQPSPDDKTGQYTVREEIYTVSMSPGCVVIPGSGADNTMCRQDK